MRILSKKQKSSAIFCKTSQSYVLLILSSVIATPHEFGHTASVRDRESPRVVTILSGIIDPDTRGTNNLPRRISLVDEEQLVPHHRDLIVPPVNIHRHAQLSGTVCELVNIRVTHRVSGSRKISPSPAEAVVPQKQIASHGRIDRAYQHSLGYVSYVRCDIHTAVDPVNEVHVRVTAVQVHRLRALGTSAAVCMGCTVTHAHICLGFSYNPTHLPRLRTVHERFPKQPFGKGESVCAVKFTTELNQSRSES